MSNYQYWAEKNKLQLASAVDVRNRYLDKLALTKTNALLADEILKRRANIFSSSFKDEIKGLNLKPRTNEPTFIYENGEVKKAVNPSDIQKGLNARNADNIYKGQEEIKMMEAGTQTDDAVTDLLTDGLKKLDSIDNKEAKAEVKREGIDEVKNVTKALQKIIEPNQQGIEVAKAEVEPTYEGNSIYIAPQFDRLRSLYKKRFDEYPNDKQLEDTFIIDGPYEESKEVLEKKFIDQFGRSGTPSEIQQAYFRINPPSVVTSNNNVDISFEDEIDWREIIVKDYIDRHEKSPTVEELEKEYLLKPEGGVGLVKKFLLKKEVEENEPEPDGYRKNSTRFKNKVMSKDPKKEGSNLTKKIKNEIKAGEAKLSF